MTLGFGFYVANFGSYDATYGSLGAAIVLLTWLYLSAYILLLGAEFNCELERQTARDTTKGPEKALGARGAPTVPIRSLQVRSPSLDPLLSRWHQPPLSESEPAPPQTSIPRCATTPQGAQP